MRPPDSDHNADMLAAEGAGNRVISIIGMHRSGTSMVAKLLSLCGVDIGPSHELLQADENNAQGYFENENFTYRVDDALLTQLGGSWDHPPSFKANWEHDPLLKPIIREARSLMSGFAGSSVWGWKDPRTTILLPFWKALIPNLKFVICVRNPLEVAKSLHKRDGKPLHAGVHLWNQYTQAAIRDTEGHARIFVFFEDFFEDAPRQIDRLVGFCGLPRPTEPAILFHSISEELKHHNCSTHDILIKNEIPAAYKLFYLGLRSLANDKSLNSSSHTSREKAASENIGKFFKLLGAFHDEQKMAQLESVLADRNQLVVKLEEAMRRREQEGCQREEELRSERTQLVEKIHLLHETVRSQQQVLTETEQMVVDLQSDLEIKEATILNQNERIDQLVSERNLLKYLWNNICDGLSRIYTYIFYDLRNRYIRSGSLIEKIYDAFWWDLNIIIDKKGENFFEDSRLVNKLKKLIAKLRRGCARLFRTARFLCSSMLIVVLMLMSIPLALTLFVALVCSDCLQWLRRTTTAPAPVNVRDTNRQIQESKIPRVAQPVSVVIPTWNGRELLDMSLPPLISALNAHAPGGEILVVDNGSSDDTCSHLAKEYRDVRVIKLPRNEGFARAANRGVIESQNPNVILLNNDMVVERDFIHPLLKAFDDEPDTFGVSSQIYFLDEKKPRWETGKVHAEFNLGRLRLFHLYRWNDDLLYPVLYAGGGASAYDRQKFLALGGFDDQVFEPVYIEDADLGYRAWKRGWPSLFAPKSVVHHKHQSTSSRIWSAGSIYGFFVKNLAALVWKNMGSYRLLAKHLCGLLILPANVSRNAGSKAAISTYWGMICQIGRVMRARSRESAAARILDDSTIMRVSRYRHAFRSHFGHRSGSVEKSRKRLLMVSPFSPYPPVHGGAVRMFSLLKRLRHSFDIDLISYADTVAEFDSKSITQLQSICCRVLLLERNVNSAGAILQPNQTKGFQSGQMAEEIEFLLDQHDYDVMQIEYTRMAHFMPPPTPGMLRVLVEHDVSFVSLGRRLAKLHGLIARAEMFFDWMRLLRYEIKAVESADLVAVMSQTDRELLGKFVDTSTIFSIPNGVDCKEFQFTENGREPDSILFVGFFRHEPNVEAVNYFCSEVLPLVQDQYPDVHFRIVGAYPPENIRSLGNKAGIEVTGRVEDIAGYYRQSTMFVAPILHGSGTRLKILEAMASGCPVISTTVGAEGLGARNGEQILIADTAADMAWAVLTLLEDPLFGKTLAKHARDYVVTHYDWDTIASQLVELYGEGVS